MVSAGGKFRTAENAESLEKSILILSASLVPALPAMNIRNSAGYPNTKTRNAVGFLARQEDAHNRKRRSGGAGGGEVWQLGALRVSLRYWWGLQRCPPHGRPALGGQG